MAKELQTITVIGTGYVGLTTAVLLAHAGHKVYALDINKDRLKVIKSGKSFFYEEGLDPLVKSAVDAGALIPTDSYEKSIPDSDVIFSSVGTPDNPDGSSNLSYVFASAEQAGSLMKSSAMYVQKSTVPVGTGKKIEAVFKPLNKNIQYVSNPEFLREGTALSDSLYFDRIVVGGQQPGANNTIIEIYKNVEKNRDNIAKSGGIAQKNTEGSYISTSLNSAELIKVTSNAFLALKISFANSIAKLADEVDADVNDIMDAVGADKRIGRAFLNAGRGYGGGCFPKDVSGLISSASEYGVDLGIMTAAAELNETMPGYIASKAQKAMGTLQGKKVAILGLAFKAGTSDARKSPGVKLANILSKSGAQVVAYDPEANEEAKEDLLRNITVENSWQVCTKNADVVFVATDWPELIQLNLDDLKKSMRGNTFVDCMNAFSTADGAKANLQYIGVGR
ncbi:UDP-glucose/GDP-mannose dehydrogenase family protein [soil metagenome]